MKHSNIIIRAVQGSGFISRAIQWRTDCKVDHVEFAWPLGSGIHADTMWLGAQPRGGVAIRDSDYIQNANFLFYSVRITETEKRRMINSSGRMLKEQYDYAAIFDNAFNQTIKLASSARRADCSEFVYRVFRSAEIDLFNSSFSSQVRTITPRDIIGSHLLKRL